ncbi:hypothetical protein KI387_018155, partial [Taxus chinensis]
TIYNMCTQKPPHDYSQQLYDRYRESFEEYINSMGRLCAGLLRKIGAQEGCTVLCGNYTVRCSEELRNIVSHCKFIMGHYPTSFRLYLMFRGVRLLE